MAGKLTIRTVKLSVLKASEHNARTHDSRNIAAIRASLERFGQVEPLVVQEGTNEIIGGNGRLEAMLAMGWGSAKVVYVDLSNEEQVALAAALNRTAELAGWDETLLYQQLSELSSIGIPVEDLGWTEQEFQSFILPEGTGTDPMPPDPDEDKPKQGRPINMTQNQREAFDNCLVRLRAELGDGTEGNFVSLMAMHFHDLDLAPFK